MRALLALRQAQLLDLQRKAARHETRSEHLFRKGSAQWHAPLHLAHLRDLPAGNREAAGVAFVAA